MSYKIVVLQSKEQLIAEIKEVVSGDKPVAYLLTNPHIVEFNKFSMFKDVDNDTSIELTLSPWIMSTSEKEIAIPINHVVALVDPLDSIKKMYLEKTNGQSNQTDSVEQQGDLVE